MYSLVAPQVRARGLTYEYRPCPPSVIVRADAEKVQQVLLNLLSNAIKFTEPGGHVRLECSCHRHDGAACASIDTGLGIPASKLEAIFEPFVQVDQAFTREGQGTGLGLSISRDLARAMGGDITVESVFGKGAVFTLSLPARSRLRPRNEVRGGRARVVVRHTRSARPSRIDAPRTRSKLRLLVSLRSSQPSGACP